MSLGVWILVSPSVPVQYSTCSKCGNRVPSAFNYCSFCGNMIHPERVWAYASKICSNCKNRIPMLARFCPECGHKQ